MIGVIAYRLVDGPLIEHGGGIVSEGKSVDNGEVQERQIVGYERRV